MRPSHLAIASLADVATAATFAVAWGLIYGSCAPPSVACKFSLCIQLCVDAWSQLPFNLAFGVLLGLAPAIVAYVALRYLEDLPPGRAKRVDSLLLSGAVAVAAAVPVVTWL